MDRAKIEALKEHITIPLVWDKLGVAGSPSESCLSPFRNESKASFSVYENGRRWTDFGTNEHGDVIDFIAKFKGWNLKDAFSLFLTIARQEGFMADSYLKISLPPAIPTKKIKTEVFEKQYWPQLRQGSVDDIRKLNQLRKIGYDGIQLAIERGHLYFFNCHKTHKRIWCVSDFSRYVRQDRMLDGSHILLKRGELSKNRTLGAASWPVGVNDIGDKTTVLLVEGMPDFVAAHQLICSENRQQNACVVGLLGRSMAIPNMVIGHFKGKRIRIFPHADGVGGAGIEAANNWWQQLRPVASKVDMIDYEEMQTMDGRKVKDVNDFLGVDRKTWKVGNVIP